MNNLKLAIFLVVFFFALIFSLSSVAGVRLISGGIDMVKNNVTVGKKVMVACTDGFIKRAIVKRDNDEQWCDAKLGSVCAANQKVPARLVCNNDYRAKISSKSNLEIGKEASDKVNSDSDEILKLKQELMEIELQRLDIADKALELKRRELQLQLQKDAWGQFVKFLVG
jgi:hypothetical protein